MTNNVIDATFQEEVLNHKGLVLVDFWANWCGPCKALGPTIEKISEVYAGKVKVLKMDVDTNPLTPVTYKVRGIPAMIFFNDGEMVDTLVGFMDISEIQKVIDELLV